MNAVDIVILCCLLPAVYIGISHGFVRQLFALAAIFLGAYIAYRFSGLLVGFVPESWGISGQTLDIIVFILAFFLTLLLVNLIGRLIQKIIRITLLEWLDRLLGVVFSLAKTAILVSVLILLAETLDQLWPFLPDESLKASRLYAPVKDIAPAIFPYIRHLFA